MQKKKRSSLAQKLKNPRKIRIIIETYSAGAGRDVASMVDNKQLKCTATLPLYITLERAVSQTNFHTFATFIL